MNYFLFKLVFDTAVHFGPSDSALSLYLSQENLPADTMFSALCHAAMSMGGPSRVGELCQYVKDNRLVLSDAMPWKGTDLYLPKPCYFPSAPEETDSQRRKLYKKISWVPVSVFPELLAYLRGEAPRPELEPSHFGFHSERTQANVSHEGGDTLPYQVGLFTFAPNCGLYFLAGCEDLAVRKALGELTAFLGLSGMGGKVSAGLGKFHLEEIVSLDGSQSGEHRWVVQALKQNDFPHFLLLTTSIPKETELDEALQGASFQLVRRGGFVQSGSSCDSARKKEVQFMCRAGAVLKRSFAGGLFQVGYVSGHPVYRYSVPMCLGVSL